MTAIDPARLAKLPEFTLLAGSHDDIDKGVCAMELVSWLAGEPFSDRPQCVSRVIGAFVRSWNDELPDDRRNELLMPLLPRLIGTAGSPALEERRALMAADWLVRTHAPAWLRLAGLTKQADALGGLPEITAMTEVSALRPTIEAVRDDAAAARVAAWDAVPVGVWDAAWDAARDAAWAAARGAAGDAVSAAAWDAVSAAAWAAVWAAAVARAAARAALVPTCDELQASALALLIRMINATDASECAI